MRARARTRVPGRWPAVACCDPGIGLGSFLPTCGHGDDNARRMRASGSQSRVGYHLWLEGDLEDTDAATRPRFRVPALAFRYTPGSVTGNDLLLRHGALCTDDPSPLLRDGRSSSDPSGEDNTRCADDNGDAAACRVAARPPFDAAAPAQHGSRLISEKRRASSLRGLRIITMACMCGSLTMLLAGCVSTRVGFRLWLFLSMGWLMVSFAALLQTRVRHKFTSADPRHF